MTWLVMVVAIVAAPVFLVGAVRNRAHWPVWIIMSLASLVVAVVVGASL